MAISVKEASLPACIGVGNNYDSGDGAVDLLISGSATPIVFLSGNNTGVSNNGVRFSGDPAARREVKPGTSGLLGKCVQLTGKEPSFRGTVIAELQVELGSTGGTDSLTECVYVQANGFRFLTQVSAVEEVPC